VGPLSSADWSLKNSLLVLAAIRSDVYVWDMSRHSSPIEKKTVHPDGVGSVKFANSSENIFATTGQPGYNVKVLNHKTSHTVFTKSLLASASISWHPRLEYLAIGHDETVSVHRVPAK
jgi:WD40 repeat protein